MRLTLRTLLAYLDDTLSPAEAREIGHKVGENPPAQELIDRVKRVTRRRGLATPPTGTEGSPSDPNTVADYLSDTLTGDQVTQFEKTCLESDIHLAEVAACHQILTLVLSEQVRIPPTARRRMYHLVKGRESLPDRKPGKTIPVGGVLADEAPEPDDADAPLLLGMSAYSPSQSWANRGIALGALTVLVLGFGVAVWMALPKADAPRPSEPVAVAVVPAVQPPQPVEKPTDPKPEEPAKKPAPPGPSEVPPPARPAGEAPPPEPGPDRELAPKAQAPRTDRVEIGKVEKPNTVVVRRKPDGDSWTRVMPDTPAVVTTNRLVSLPGYWSVLRLESGVTVDLWGNVPELFRAPILESSVTPYLPYDGFHADLAVHAGRVYLQSKNPKGAAVRLRVRDQVWDVTLADEKTEVVVEVVNNPAPGATPEPPQTLVLLAVQAGQATLKPARYKDPVTLPKGGEAMWDSKAGQPAVRTDLDAQARAQQSSYLSKFQPNFDAQLAKPTKEALDEFAKNMTDPARVRATLDAALQPPTEGRPGLKGIAAARIAVFGFAALSDVSGLIDGLNHPDFPLARQTAFEGLRAAVARDPDLAGPFRQALVDKLRVEEPQADVVLRLLRGLTDAERADPATLDRLVTAFQSPALCVREVAVQTLRTYLDPADPLGRVDAGAPAEVRAQAARAWAKKVEEIKKAMAAEAEKKKEKK